MRIQRLYNEYSFKFILCSLDKLFEVEDCRAINMNNGNSKLETRQASRWTSIDLHTLYITSKTLTMELKENADELMELKRIQFWNIQRSKKTEHKLIK